MKTKVYLDNAATTPIDPQVIEAMVKVMQENYGNPSSTHSVGQEAKSIIEGVRRKVADALKVVPGEIIFSSCGTESNNLIIQSCVAHLGVERIITSPMEHKCVSEAVKDAESRCGVEVVYLQADQNGEISLEKIHSALAASEKKTLVTLMHANNEIGNLLDIEAVAKLCKEYGAYFHSDTVQTVGHLDLDFSKIPVDFASCSAHKFHGPKGAGFAFVRKSTKLKPMILGGTQERELRAGTENVVGIVGLGKALELCLENMEEYSNHMGAIKQYAVEKLSENIPGVKFNGFSQDPEKSLYTVLSVLLPFKNPLIGLQLDMKGISISQGSACSSGAAKPSMVMMSLLSEEEMEVTTPLRVSFSHLTTKEEIDYFASVLKEIYDKTTIEKTNAVHR